MNILSIGSDRLLFSPSSEVRRRVLLQARAAGEMHVIVFSLAAHGFTKVHDGPLHVYPTASRSRWRMPIDAMRIARKLPKPDLVSAQDPFWSGHVAYHISGRTDAKLQLQIHTDIFSPAFRAQSLGNRLKVRWAKFHVRRADCVRVVSNRIKDSLLRIGIKVPISVLPIFIDADTVRSSPAIDLRHTYPSFDRIILVAARLEREKNVDDAIRAMSTIVRIFPHAGLLLAGDGSRTEVLKMLIYKLGLEKNVAFLGRTDDIYSLYKSSDCMIAATADYEGYGAATVEALTAGCPVVSRDIGVAREAGAIIAGKDEIGQKVIEVLRSGQKGKLMSHLPTAEEWAKQWFSDISACCDVY